MHKQKIKAFILVELIVVIIILAILGTIAFISLQGYSADARDSVRTRDLSTMKSALELFNLEAGKYPMPSEETIITFSGITAWSQGYFGDDTKANLNKLDKVPTDPLTDKKYVYSTTNTRTEYQLSGIMESDSISMNDYGFSETNAVQATALLKITGTYNGQVLKVSTGGLTYVLAVPSLITSTGGTLESIIQNNNLAYNGYRNLPLQYAGGKYNINGETNLNLVNSGSIVVYEGDLSTLSYSTSIGILARKTLIENLQQAYNGTSISNIGEIAQILNTNTTDQAATEYVGTNLVANSLGGAIQATKRAPIITYTNCDAITSSGYTIPQLNHNQSSNVTKTGSITNGSQSYGAKANCNNGTLSITDEATNITCNNGYVEQSGGCVADVCGSTVPSNAHSTAISQTVNQNWIQNTTPGVCTFDCDSHYTWNGSSCLADTQNTTCTGKPANSIWNTASSIIQTWNGTVWSPVETGTYNTSASTTSCRYTCDTGYHTEDAGVSCVIDTRSCIISNATASQAWNGSSWGTCTVTSCNSNYTQSANSCIDQTAPTGGDFTINSGSSSTSSTGVTLNITCPTDAAGSTPIQFAYGSSTNPTNWGTCTSGNISFTLSSGLGTKTVYMKFKDSAGNITSEISKNIILQSYLLSLCDTTPVNYLGTGDFVTKFNNISNGKNILVIDNNNSTSYEVYKNGNIGTTNPAVSTTYNYYYNGTWRSYNVTNATGTTYSSAFQNCSYQPRLWLLSGNGCTGGGIFATCDGYCKITGVNSFTQVYMNTYHNNNLYICEGKHDKTPPIGGNFTINNGNTTTGSASVTLNITCPTDAEGSTPIQFAYGSSTNPTNWATCTSGNISFTLPGGVGTKTVYMKFRDSSLNTTNEISRSIDINSYLLGLCTTSPTNYIGTGDFVTKFNNISNGKNILVIDNNNATGYKVYKNGNIGTTNPAVSTTYNYYYNGTWRSYNVTNATGTTYSSAFQNCSYQPRLWLLSGNGCTGGGIFATCDGYCKITGVNSYTQVYMTSYHSNNLYICETN